MKKNSFGNTAIPAAVVYALTSTSLLAATVYEDDISSLKVGGRIEFRGDFGDGVDGTMNNRSRMRLNIAGETKLSDDLTGFGYYEAQQQVNNTGRDNEARSDFEQRHLYAGLKGSFGRLSLGRQDTAMVQVAKLSDLGNHTDNQVGFITAGGKRVNNSFVYGYEREAFSIQASYLAGNEKNTDGAAVSALYVLPVGLTLGLGYAAGGNGKDTDEQQHGKGNQILAGASYTISGLTLAATYTEGDLDDKVKSEFKGSEIASEYKFTRQFRMIAAYGKQKEQKNADARFETSDHYYELTGRFDLSRNMRTYVTYKNEKMDGKDDSIRLGLRYNF